MHRGGGYEEAARGIAAYLAERQRPDGGFPGPDHYGVASALWLWSHFRGEFAGPLSRAWDRLKESPPTTHGEFNHYARLHARAQVAEGSVEALLGRLRMGGRHSANWMLLRAVCRSHEGPVFAPRRAALAARAALARYARQGLIADRPGVRSFAYHAFCGALLVDLWRNLGARGAGRAAVEAARFLAPFVLPNGDTLYVGRGQQQIFGYGALLYLFEAAEQMTGQSEFGELAGRVFAWLMRYQRRDGSFPLVLREGEEPEPWLPDATRPGWYTYNRYADYLPFLGCMLLKAAEGSAGFSLPTPAGVGRAALQPPPIEAAAAPRHPDFRIVAKPRYSAVLARPCGAPTNDLAFPYVCVDGESLFPCYGRGGERLDPGELPLPYGVLADGKAYAFRDRLRYRLSEDGLVGESRLARHARRFEFHDDGFDCLDEIAFRQSCAFESFVPANFLFGALRAAGEGGFETWHGKARARLEMEPAGDIIPKGAVTASGQLVALRHEVKGFEARAGERVEVRLRVGFG